MNYENFTIYFGISLFLLILGLYTLKDVLKKNVKTEKIDELKQPEGQKKDKSSNLVIVNDYTDRINKEGLYHELDQNRPYEQNQDGDF